MCVSVYHSQEGRHDDHHAEERDGGVFCSVCCHTCIIFREIKFTLMLVNDLIVYIIKKEKNNKVGASSCRGCQEAAALEAGRPSSPLQLLYDWQLVCVCVCVCVCVMQGWLTGVSILYDNDILSCVLFANPVIFSLLPARTSACPAGQKKNCPDHLVITPQILCQNLSISSSFLSLSLSLPLCRLDRHRQDAAGPENKRIARSV